MARTPRDRAGLPAYYIECRTLYGPDGIYVREWDEIRITGRCSEFGRVENRGGMIGAVCPETVEADGYVNEAAIKVWPDDDWPDRGSGKIWFGPEDIERVELVRRDEINEDGGDE